MTFSCVLSLLLLLLLFFCHSSLDPPHTVNIFGSWIYITWIDRKEAMRTECFLGPQVYCSTTMVLIRLFCLDFFICLSFPIIQEATLRKVDCLCWKYSPGSPGPIGLFHSALYSRSLLFNWWEVPAGGQMVETVRLVLIPGSWKDHLCV